MREEKGREFKRNVRKGGKKKQFFLIDCGATEQEKRNNLEAISCNKKATEQGK
jgi:hypothetical protein